MKKQFFIFLFFLFIGQIATAQRATILGNVKWEDTEKKATKSQVILKYTSHKTEVDSNGNYKINNIKPGDYTVIVYTVGLRFTERSIALKPGVNTLNIELDSIAVELSEFSIIEERVSGFGLLHMAGVEDMDIYASKKNEVIVLSEINANLATNNPRQIYSRIAGLNIWESSSGGLQLDIGGRGLSPNRTSNFNTRQNGYDIAADALGYPESYYSPPTEAIDRIEVTRGASSLQYGTQFGGVINFRLKAPHPTKKIDLLLRQSIGSFGLFNTFNAISGTNKNKSYIGFINYKKGNGFRPNSAFESIVGFIQFNHKINEKLQYKIEFTKMKYLAQQPGGLTDTLFNRDPFQSIRKRNWFSVDWNVGAITFNYKLNSKWRFESRNFGLLGARNALGVLGYINRLDPENERDLIKDNYLNTGSENRAIHTYNLLGNPSNWLIGLRYYRGFTKRKQGYGSDESNANFDFIESPYSNYQFPSQNVAVFSENVFQLSPKWSITPGIRFEHIITKSEGAYNVSYFDLAGNTLFDTLIADHRNSERSFVISGVGTSYKFKKHELYANISQNYRAINFNDMRVNNPNLKVNPDLQDEKGFSADFGLRGKLSSFFIYDLSLYYLKYIGRIGTIAQVDQNTFRIYRYRTNVSDSRNIGLESYAELDILGLLSKGESKSRLSLFTNFTLQDARYINSEEPAYQNKKVENAPNVILKTGLDFKKNRLKSGFQFSYNANQYSDATNSAYAANALVGIIPSYWVMDVSLSYEIKKWTIETGVNNLTNEHYFTRRAEGYPGPGIIPSEPVNFYIAIQLHL